MISCKQAAEAISRSLDGSLTWRARLALRLHLLACRLCRLFRRQAELLQEAGRQAGQQDDAQAMLSESARQRIKQALRQERGGTP